MRSLVENKKGQFESALLAVVTIFIIGIIIFFTSHLKDELYGEFDKYLNESTAYNNTEAQTALDKIIRSENSRIWDYGFLAMFIGIIIQMMLLSFATRINIAFYWIFAILGIIILIVGAVLSNVWQAWAADPVFATTLTRFPIMDALLGTYFPLAVVTILFVMMLVLFGKPPERQN